MKIWLITIPGIGERKLRADTCDVDFNDQLVLTVDKRIVAVFASGQWSCFIDMGLYTEVCGKYGYPASE